MILTWNEVECHKQNGIILHYHVHRLLDGEIISKVVDKSEDIYSVVYFPLCPFLKYVFNVSAENAAGRGPNATYKGEN